MEDINSHAMLKELLKRSDEKDPGGFPVCLYHYIGESVKLYLRHDAVIKHINLKQCEHKQLNEVSECVKCGQVITVIKQVSTPHPSDSDIESRIKELWPQSFDSSKKAGFRTGAKWMRDRMNGEIAKKDEAIERLNKLCKKRIEEAEYWKEVALNPDCICERTTEIDKCPVHSTGPEK